MVKNKIKKFFSSKKNTVIFISALLILVLATSITFAWFKNIFTVDGVEMNTGMFEYQFLGYSGAGMTNNFKYSTNSSDSGFKYIGDVEGITAASDTSQIISSSEPGVLYYVVRKTAGSIDLDVSLSFEADFSQLVRFSEVIVDNNATGTTDSATESIGSFWYSISSMKAGGAEFSDISSIENYIKANAAKFTTLTKGGMNKYFPDIRKEIISDSLGSEDAFVCFRVEYGIQGATPANLGLTIPLGVKLHVAQKGGLGDYTGKTHRVFTLDELNTALTVYQPRDTIIIAGNIEYEGDLSVDNLLNLVIENGSLTVKGNMRYTYAGTSSNPDSDAPTISKFDIQVKSGFLKIIEMDSADLGEGVSAGGNLYLDIPNSTMNIYGQNDSGLGNADIYIQNQFTANTAYADKGESAAGLILSNVRICNTDATETAKSIYLREDTQLTVGQGVALGTVFSIHDFYDSTSSLRLHVQNYGTIDKIDFSSMQFISISDPLPHTPRILIDNYSAITNPIKLANFSRKWDPETPDALVTATSQNTRVIWEQGAGDMTIDNSNQSNFRNEHIESIYKTTLIDKVNGEDDNIVVHYMANKLEGLGGTDGNGITTIEKLVRYYQPGGLGAKDYEIAANDQIKSLKIICYTGYYLTEADYSFIRNNLTNVEVIDLSEAESASDASKVGGAVPNEAFKGLAQLKQLKLSDKDVIWGANLFEGTQIDEITLPVRLTTLNPNALVGIKYLHMGNKSGLVYQTEFMNRVIAREAYAFCTDNARNELIALIEESAKADDDPTNDPVGTFKERTEGVPTTTQLNKIANIRLEAQRYGDYFLTLYDDSCRVVAYIPKGGKTFNANNEENNQSVKHADGNVYRFTFSGFDIVTYDADGNIVSDNKYDVVEYDDFAFYQINVGGNGDTLTFNEKLNSIGDAAFYNAGLPKNVDLGGCKTLGHAALANNSISNLAGLKVETAGYYVCGNIKNRKFFNFPRLSWVYGSTFGGLSGNFKRIDIGLVQTAPDAISKTSYADSLTGGNLGNFGDSAIVIHTDYDHSTNITELTKFSYGSGAYKVLVTEEYKSLATNAKYNAHSLSSLGVYTADDLKFMTFDGRDVTGSLFEPGDLAYLQIAGTSDYKLLCNIGGGTIDLSQYAVDGVYTLPAYSDETGTTTTVGGGALHYISLSGADTLTFADSYRKISDGGLGPTGNAPSSYNKNKYFAHVDLNNIETVGVKVFWGWPNLLTVRGQHVTSINKHTFQDCKNLRIVSLPNLGGNCEQSFYNCISLKMALVGPITGSNVFGVNSGAGIDPIEDLILFINAKNAPSDTGAVYLTGTGGKVYFQVISLGGEFFWDRSGNSPYYNTDSNPDNDVAYPYSQLVVGADVSSLMFADWVDGDPISVQLANSVDSKYTYTYTVSTPTYMFSEDQDGLTIQLSFGLGNIVADTYVIPDTLYVKNEPVDSIVGNNNIKYFTTNVEGSSSTGKKVVAIEDNIYSGGKITANTVQFPTGLKTIGKNAFSGCTIRNGINITGAEGGLIIEDRAFYDVTAGSLTISNVTEIGNEAFYGIKNKDEFGASATMSSIQLGSKLSSIGESAFEGANAASVTTTHDNANPIILTIGENAFKNLKNGTGGEVAVNFSGAVADFGANSFYNVKLSNLTAPNTILVRANAFYMADITGTADFSQGVPAEMVAAHGYQIVEPYGFRGTSSDKNQLGTVKLGANCLLKGDYYSKDNIYPVVQDRQDYKGAFHYCDIKSLRFNENEAQEPEAIAFVGCSFKEIRFEALTTFGINYGGVGNTDNSKSDDIYHQFCGHDGVLKNNRDWTYAMFINCTTLGDVYFTNITNFKFTFRGGSNHEIIMHDLVITNLNSGMFSGLKLVGEEIVFPDSMTVNGSAFNSTTVDADLVFGSNTTIAGSEPFKDSTFNGDIYFGDGLTVSASYPFERSKFYGTVSFGSINFTNTSVGHGMFGNNHSESNAKNGYAAHVVFRSTCTALPTRFLAFAKFGTVDFSQSSITSAGTAAFAHSEFDKIIGMEKIKTFGDHCFGEYNKNQHTRVTTVTSGLNISNAESIGEGAFVNLTFKDAVSLSKILEIKANAFKNSTFEQPLTVGSVLGTNILDSAFEGAKFNSSIDLAGVKTVGASAFKGATFSETLQLKDITSFGANAFTNAIVNGDLIFGTRAEDGAGGYTYTGPASAIGESAFGSLTTYDTDGTTVLSYLPGVTVTGKVNFVNVKGIDKYGFQGAVLKAPITFGADINIGDSAFYGVQVPEITFAGSPVIQTNAFKQSNITTLTFEDAGEIRAEAFAEGTYGTINLGSVASLGGSYTPATDTEAAQVTGAFRSASIGTINFQNSCVPTESIPMPIAVKAFADATINFLNFGGDWTENAQGKLEQSISTSKALVGDVAENVTDATYKAGAYSPFSGAKIERLNLNGVTSIGYGYFANMEVGQVDTITSETIELQAWSLSSTTIKTGSMVFTGDVTMRDFATCGQLKIPNGNLEFNGSLVAAGGKNQVNITGNMIINNLSGTGEGKVDNNTDNVFLGSIATGYTDLSSTISGDLIFRNTETIACGFRNLTIGGLIFENVEKATQLRGFYKIVIKNRIDFNCLQQVGGRTFGGVTFPNNTVLNLSNLTSTGNYTFSSAKNIVAINAPVLTSVSDQTFSSINTLEEIRMPSLVSTNGQYCFASNSKLSYVFVPMLRNIVSACFSDCSSLKRVEFPSLQKIDGTPFSGCSKLEEIVIGDQFSTLVNKVGFPNNFKRLIFKTPLNYDATTGNIGITGYLKLPAGAKLLVPYELKADYDAYFNGDSTKTLWSNITKDQIDTIQFILSDGTGVTYLAELLYGNKIEIVDIIDTVNAMRNASYTFPSTLVDGNTTYTVVSIASAAMQRIPSTVTTIGLPSTLEYINFSGIDLHINVQAYSIENNSFYQVIDGVLYTADGKTLVMYPTGRSADIVVPATVERIGEYAFAGNQGVGTITFTSSVTILDGAFADCYELSKIAFEAVVVDGVASAPVVRFTGRNTVSGCSSLAAESIQICGTAYPEVLYDTQLYSLFKLTALPTSPATPPEQGGENTENGAGGTETPETPAA